MADLDREIVACARCPRLVPYIRQVAATKRRAYRDWDYWGLPVPSFGPADARLLILGLAPGAHGANRTGRVFTGDSSGDLLYRVLHTAGFATQAVSTSREDGLQLRDARISCSIHCAPPGNRPLPEEIRNCREWLREEFRLMPQIQGVVALGGIAFTNYLAFRKESRVLVKNSGPFRFAHNVLHRTGPDDPWLIASYHPSQQNTSTGKLSEPMLLDVFQRARELLSGV